MGCDPRQVGQADGAWNVVKVCPRGVGGRWRGRWDDGPFGSFDMGLIASPFARVLRKFIKWVNEGVLLSGRVRCHSQIVDEGSFDVITLVRTTFDVIGSPNFSNAVRFTLTVSRRSSTASGVSVVI